MCTVPKFGMHEQKAVLRIWKMRTKRDKTAAAGRSTNKEQRETPSTDTHILRLLLGLVRAIFSPLRAATQGW